jgi:hypothetical protein
MTWNDIGIAVWPVFIVGLLWLAVRQFRREDRHPKAGE